MSNYRINTKCIQSGYTPQSGEPRVVPIVQSTTYKYDSSNELADLFDLKADGFFYTRLANPTLDAVEKKIADLEGGIGAMLTASGQAATTTSILNICKSGDHIIASNALYGGTFNLFVATFKKLGIETTLINPDLSYEELDKYVQDNTKLIFVESISNPQLVVTDIEKMAKLAHSHDIPLIVDNTFPTPINFRPIEYGADIVVHSTSKYMDGHAVTLGGVIVDSGNFNWANGKFPEFTEPDETYHGLIYTKDCGNAAFITKARVQLMRDYGMPLSPQNAFLLNLGLETLHLRMERHCSNALKVAEFLSKHPKISWVQYPGLEGDKYYDLAKKYMPNGTCGVMAFGLKDGKAAAQKFMENLKLAAMVIHVADARTCVLHPATTTHRQLSDEQLLDCGITPELLRMSIGIEDVEDLLEDIAQALDKI
ncbi:MAG: O-acetylhomoserine aminocarboxypropyltransferase/cysteine synthase [Lachnospiraceae bacterium]|nr:O-acetylhomoserine aminocarboxypropyltransferase/cysteine synthase [Lachnospiraceae bacterium]